MQFYHLLDYCVKQVGSGAQVKLETLQAGTINQNYCLSIDDHKYLVKQFSGNRWLPIDRNKTFDLQLQLAQLQLAPFPIHLSDKQDVYIEQWLEYKPLSMEDDDKDICIDALAASLIRIHGANAQCPALDLPAHWQRYLKAMSDPDKKWRKKTQEYTTLWRKYEARYGDDFVLCHNDLHLSHVSPVQALYLDWEYAGTSCRFFDVLACILANQFEQHNADALIRRYIELSDFHREEVLQRIRTLQPMVIFTHQLWWQANQHQSLKRQKPAK
ncbi:phosphotransferase [Glaciecola sp. SC05]|uniref:phosphotransferase n=1 Tax=Glaciecola sp. SC05 TaxID=1987355 RepID=UPI0035274536